MTTAPQSMSDDELPMPAFRLTWRGGAYYVSEPSICDTDCYTAEQLHAVRAQAFHDGQVAGRATAEQAGKVEMADCCDTPHYCSSVRRCTRQDAKPTQPAATQPVAWQYRVDVHRDGNWSNWRPCTENFHDEIIEFGECVEGDDPRGVIADSRALYAAPVSPSREVEALAVKWRGIAKQQRIAADRDDDRGDTESAARMRGMAERSEYCANEIEYMCALAPVQEKAPCVRGVMSSGPKWRRLP